MGQMLPHFTVEVFVVHNQRVLLRVHDKLGRWLSIGGHLEIGEDPIEAAIREVREEVGLHIRIDSSHMLYHEVSPGYRELVPPVFMCRVEMFPAHEHVTLTYFGTLTDDPVTPATDVTITAFRWFTREELYDPAFGLSRSIRCYALTALDRIGGHKSD